MENKNNKTGLIVLVIILSIMVVGLASYIICDKIINTKEETPETENNNNNNNKNEANNNTNQEENKNNNNIDGYSPKKHKINLTEKNYNISLNDDTLKLNFIGKEVGDILQYNLEITINDIKIKDNLFTKDELYIWEQDYAAQFTIYELNEYYFFISFIAKQNDGQWILITDKLGNIIKEFYDVAISFEDENTFKIEDCKNYNVMPDKEETTYTIENNVIKERIKKKVSYEIFHD